MKSRRTGTRWVGWVALRPAANQGTCEEALASVGWRPAGVLPLADRALSTEMPGATILALECLRQKTGSGS